MFVYKKWGVVTHKKNGDKIFKLYKVVFLLGIIPLWISVSTQEAKHKYSMFWP